MLARCIDQIEELKAAGVTAMLDPCPNDLGRDVEFMAEVASRTGFQIICATGLYKEVEGGTAYWHFRKNFGPVVDAMAELFISELTEGIGSTGIRAGIIKVATGPGQMSEYERQIFEAAAKASVATGAPITTHTDQGTVGDAQQRLLTELGVPAHRIVIGHSCGTSNHDYHLGIARARLLPRLRPLRPRHDPSRHGARGLAAEAAPEGRGRSRGGVARLGLVLARHADPEVGHARLARARAAGTRCTSCATSRRSCGRAGRARRRSARCSSTIPRRFFAGEKLPALA